jgi:hypothetical protein
VVGVDLQAAWSDGDPTVVFRRTRPGAGYEFVKLDPGTGHEEPAFDHAQLAALGSSAIGDDVDVDRLPVRSFDLDDGGHLWLLLHGEAGAKAVRAVNGSKPGLVDLAECPVLGMETRPPSRVEASRDHGGEVNLIFVNQTDDPVQLWWVDRNVDPASTMQCVDRLIKADKDFDLIVFPGTGHGAGTSAYGKWRMRDFFVRHLLGVEPRRE